MKIAVIPARGGSKRIPRKNIKPFCGKPMIAWSIQAARESGLFDSIIVSTDDPEIAEAAKACGAVVPFVRPVELSNDFVGTVEVISHATEWALDQGLSLEAVCCIYATAPLIQVEDLKKGLDMLIFEGWEYVFSAAEFEAPVFRSFKKNSEGGVEMIFPEHFATRSQDLPATFYDAGQFYWGSPQAWIECRKIFESRSTSVILPKWRVQDIDNCEDWLKAELIFNQLGNIKNGS